ncbi:hypothetical protein OSTOST_24109 [Ostertagia ostertagi]
MVSYMAELSLLMSHMSCGKSIKDHPAVFRASKHRTILERIRPIEQKMRSQIDKLVQSLDNGEAKAPLRARPDQMEFDDDNDESDEDQGNEEDNKKPKKYVPPKMMARMKMGMKRRLWKKREACASKQSRSGTQTNNTAMLQRSSGKRVSEGSMPTGRGRNRGGSLCSFADEQGRKETRATLKSRQCHGRLVQFRQLHDADESGEALSTNKKRKGGHAGGPKGKKSRFERKKSQKSKLKSKNKAIKRRT